MRVSRERQIFLALCALDEIADQAKTTPIQPSFALRFTLAFLWACCDGKDRGNIDGLWRNLTALKSRENRNPQGTDQKLCHAYARAQINGLMQSLGLDVEQVQRRINRARGRSEDYRPTEKLWMSMSEREKRELSRRGKYCDLTRIDQPFPKLRS